MSESEARSKTALVVGGTSGIGKEIARRLAAAHVRTVIVGRNRDKTEAVALEIGAAEWLLVDVNDQADVRRLAAVVLGKYRHLDYLVLTAGLLFNDKRVTKDGVEGLLAVNYLWRFQLTGLIKDCLAAAPQGSRVLNVAGAGLNKDVFFDDHNFERTPWGMFSAAWQAQQLNDVFTIQAQRRWGALGNGITFHVVFPGLVLTSSTELSGFEGFVFRYVLYPLKKSVSTSGTQLMPLLLDPIGSEGGKLWHAGSWGPARQITPAARVVDDEYGAKCWELSESLIKIE